MTALVVVEGAVIVVLTVLVAGLLRSHAEILRALHELGVTEEQLAGEATAGAPTIRTQPGVPQPRGGAAAVLDPDAPAFDVSGTTPSGGAKQVGVVGAKHTTLLAFLSSGCLTCRDFWDAFSEPLALPGTDTRLVVVTKGAESESTSAVASLAPDGVTVIMSTQAWADYAVPVAPYFLLIDGPSSAVIGEGAAANWETVTNLLTQALADAGMSAAAEVTPATRARAEVREADTDDALRAAGIEPGDPRLHHDQSHDEGPR